MIHFEIQALRIPFKLMVRHASASRARSASLWICARRGEHRGYGEGCPRDYVTGETAQSCARFLKRWLPEVAARCETLEALEAFVEAQRAVLDEAPAAWCAVESALLELFARERGQSVEGLLGMQGPSGRHHYSAIINNGPLWETTLHMDQYLAQGMRDFKVKLSGVLEEDRAKLARLSERAQAHEITLSGVRLDANNLWAGRVEEALRHLELLGEGFVGVEEPVAARDVAGMRRLYEALGLPIILDESLCRAQELALYEGEEGWIGNIKVSKAGGVLRGCALADAIAARGWPIIVGAHVGETSILTRAAQLVARRAGAGLLAQEGAFGARLMERDMTAPSLCFGGGGVLDMDAPYREERDGRLEETRADVWRAGWGVAGRMGRRAFEEVAGEATQMADGCQLWGRRWGALDARDVVLAVHGEAGHSGWFAALGAALSARGVALAAYDLRGCGESQGEGWTPAQLLGDLSEQVAALSARHARVHLAGWGQGASLATVFAARHGGVASLMWWAPGLLWGASYRASRRAVEGMLAGGDREEAGRAALVWRVSAAMEDEAWREQLEDDVLLGQDQLWGAHGMWEELRRAALEATQGLEVPVMAWLGTRDQVVDSAGLAGSVRAGLARCVVWEELEAGHGLALEGAEALAERMCAQLRGGVDG
jgi:L-alanine-DL-glutamate epimerase-like enolase superfamily enzyme/pimeloyl-ACP methyl ester carboxylesterase